MPEKHPEQGLEGDKTKWHSPLSIKLFEWEVDELDRWAKEETEAGVKTSRHDIMRRLIRAGMEERRKGSNPFKRVEETVTKLST